MTVFSHLGVLVEVLEDLPAPVSVLPVLSEPVQIKQALHRLRAKEVVSVCKLRRGQTDTHKKQSHRKLTISMKNFTAVK